MADRQTKQILSAYLTHSAEVEREYVDEPLRIRSGRLPADLRGVLLRNGAGRLRNHGVPYEHPFDGDGMILRFAIEDGAVRYSNRYVRTREFLAEEAAGRVLYRSLGTNIPGGALKNIGKFKVKNAANTSVIQHGGHTLALWEGGLPHAIDPVTLETLGRFDYDGRLRHDGNWIDRQINEELAFSAHPRVHPTTGELYNFGTIAGRKNYLALYRVSPQGMLTHKRFLPLRELHFLHDFVLTASGYQVFFLLPVAFDLWRTGLGLAPAIASMRGKSTSPTTILVVHPDGELQYIEAEGCFIFHYANGYEDAAGRLVVEGLRMDGFPDADATRRMMLDHEWSAEPALLTRYTLDLAAGTVSEKTLAEAPLELPEINPNYAGRPHRFSWAMSVEPAYADGLLHGIGKYDSATGAWRYHNFYPHLPGEPLMVPRAGGAEDEGYLLVQRHHHTLGVAQLVVLDARDMVELAVVDLPHAVPLGFHGCWLGED